MATTSDGPRSSPTESDGTLPDLTPLDVAEDLQISRWTVLGYLRSGALPGYRTTPGGPWRVQPDELARWKRERTAASRPTDPNRIEPRSAHSRGARARRAR